MFGVSPQAHGGKASLHPGDVSGKPMRVRFALLLIAALGCGCARGNGGGTAPGKRVIILGFDGLDYEYTKKLMEEGKPQLFAGGWKAGSARSTSILRRAPSPVNFITGMDSGGHGIFDFVQNPETLAVFSRAKSPLEEPRSRSEVPVSSQRRIVELLDGAAFWEVLENHGIETTSSDAREPSSLGTATRELSGWALLIPGRRRVLLYTRSSSPSRAGHAGGDAYKWTVRRVVEAKLYGPNNRSSSRP
jgi:hypothetical protein